MARARPTSPRCPRCNAPFTLVAEQVLYTCHYCNASIDTRGEQAPRPLYQAPSATGPNRLPLVLGAGIAVMLLGSAAGFFAMASSSDSYTPPPARAEPPPPPPTAQVPPAPPPKPRFAWDMDNTPTVTDVNGDGTDDIIGTIRRGTSFDRYSTAAFDGKTLEPLWEVPIEGAAPTDLASRERYIRQGNRLVRREAMAVSLLELATGKVVGRVALSDKPDKLCIPQGDTSSVWVSVMDQQNILLDTTTATARPASQTPPNCQPPERGRYDCSPAIHRKTHLPCSLALKAPPIPGFRGQYRYTAHGLDVVLGARNPGTRVPMAAVFEKGAKEPLWHGAIADMDIEQVLETTPEALDISEDALFVAYRLRAGGMHLVRRDVRTGAVVWDVPIPRSKDGSLVTSFRKQGDRLYVPHWMWLDVFDAKTGNVIGTLGTW
ncbi:hypothetical protein OWM54_10395 [Myxococcus sp. MISCRS1]|uniref:hypothetical protein n=1 Tax=Myxococcus sp. MISCRS1 TaxID=2996786 RepID=UPI002271E075|nr:hypothetical protein [Myxococcus sp. MISCRS1]MCY0997545.1 hypothetical protein [Myxococcus sp. MISCRS1]